MTKYIKTTDRKYKSRSIEERFWTKVDKSGPVPEHRPDLGPCWLWTGATNSGGYGAIWSRDRQTLISVHRLSFLIKNGTQPKFSLDHLCENRLCVNPDHLEDVDVIENISRYWATRRTGDMPSTFASTQIPKTSPPEIRG